MQLAEAARIAARCQRGDPVDAVVADYTAFVGRGGFTSVAAGASVGAGAEAAYRFYFNTWPADWLAIYERESIFSHDPMVSESRFAMGPYLWSDVRRRYGAHAGYRRSEQLADAYGWRELVALPIHGPAHYVGLFVAAAKTPVTLDAEALAAFELASVAVHRRCRATPGYGLPRPGVAPLTDRQIACMRLVAQDKTDAEIAEILGVSIPTAHFHVEQAKTRLGARSRRHAVSLMSLDGVL